MTITLTGEPRSTSHIYQHTCRGRFAQVYMTSAGKALKEDYQWQIRSQHHGAPLAGALRVSATFYFGTRRKQDIDNFNKLALDACSGLLWEDDSQIVELTLRKAYDPQAPRIELIVEEELY